MENQRELQEQLTASSSKDSGSPSLMDTAEDNLSNEWEQLKITRETAALKQEIRNLESENKFLRSKVTSLEEDVETLKGMRSCNSSKQNVIEWNIKFFSYAYRGHKQKGEPVMRHCYACKRLIISQRHLP
jgi:predicted nuclease with TOPRIM domain